MVNWKKLVRRIPNKVQIKNKVFYEIVWIDEFTDDHETMGETRFNQRQIVIKRGLSPKLTIVTLLHEIAHCVSFEHGVNLTENQVLALENSFYFLLKPDNVFIKD